MDVLVFVGGGCGDVVGGWLVYVLLFVVDFLVCFCCSLGVVVSYVDCWFDCGGWC